jgi:beta-catenin-like protein 1
MDRLDEETSADDRQGVFNSLGLVESIVTVLPSMADKVAPQILPFLLGRIKLKTADSNLSNRVYASEILSILLGYSRENRMLLDECEGVDVLLRVVSAYKKKDPKEGDEVEMLSNCFDSLCSALAEPEIKQKFVSGEGIELMLIMLKYDFIECLFCRERKMARIYALKVLNHSLSGTGGEALALHFMDAGGMKRAFPIFLGQGVRKLANAYVNEFSESKDDEHIISIILSLWKSSSDKKEYRDRLVSKFVENDGEKLARLVTCFHVYKLRVGVIEADFAMLMPENRDMDIEYLRRLDSGLYTLQMICLVVAFVYLEADHGDFSVFM